MPVRINNNYLVPAPLVTYNKSVIKQGDGKRIGSEYTFTLTGQLLADKGSPYSSGSDPIISSNGPGYLTQSPDDDTVNSSIDTTNMLTAIMKKQEYLRYLCSGETLNVDILGYNAEEGLRFVGTLESLDFDDQSRWTNYCGYTISLKTNNFTESSNGIFSDNSNEDSDSFFVSSFNESWSIKEDTPVVQSGSVTNIDKTFTVTHSISAVGQRVYESDGGFKNGLEPWQQASGYVNSVGLGFGNFPEGYYPISDSGYISYNYSLTQDIDRAGGSYSVSEEFVLLPSGSLAKENVSFSIDTDLGAIKRVSINGTIEGLSTYSPNVLTNDKYDNAVSYYNTVSDSFYVRATGVSGFRCLNETPISTNIGKNPNEGTVSYSVNYDTRPDNYISGSLTEDIQVSDIYPGQLFSVVPIIGGSQPVIQYTNARSEYKRSLSVNVVMAPSGCTFIKPSNSEMENIFNMYNPTGDGAIATQTFYGPPQESWSPKTGQYSFNIEWTYRK